MSWALVNSLAQNFGTSPSGAINTTGSDLIIVSLSLYAGTIAGRTVTDSAGNSYTLVNYVDGSSYHNAMYYCKSPITGSSVTFSCSSNANALSLAVACYSGSSTSGLDQVVLGTDGGGSTYQAGAITPTVGNELIICSIASASSSGVIDSGFTVDAFQSNSGSGVGNALGRLFQTTAATKNPTWTTGGTDNIGINASFFGGTSLSETINDTITLSDNIGLSLAGFKAVSDSLNFNDNVNLGLNIPIGIFGDSISLSDSVFFILFGTNISFGVTDSLQLSDSVTSNVIIPVTVADSLSLSDTVAKAIYNLLAISDTITLSDSVQFSANMLKNLTFVDVLMLTDRISTFLANTPVTIPYSDSLALSDSVTIVLHSGLSISDSLNLTDNVTVNFINPPTGDTISFSDSVQIVMNIGISISDSLSLLDGISTNQNWNQSIGLSLADSITISDALSLSLISSSNLSDSLVFSDSVAFSLNIAVPNSFGDSLNFTDLVSFLLSDSRGNFSDSLQLSDSIQFVLNDSDTAYLRRYLNDMDTVGNDSGT